MNGQALGRHQEPQKNWNVPNSIALDVDKRKGYGPETITFNNVVPGVYQVLVHSYSPTRNVKRGNPRITVYLGGNNLKLKCFIPDSCRTSSRLWNALNVEVSEAGMVDGEPQFAIRVLDIRAGGMKGLSRERFGLLQHDRRMGI